MVSQKAATLANGLSEQLINECVQASIIEAEFKQLRPQTRPLDSGDSFGYFVRYLTEHLRVSFASFPEEQRLEKQLELANRIILLLAEMAPGSVDPAQAQVLKAELLLAFPEKLERPDTPLSNHCILTGTRQDPTLLSQLKKEFLTADRVDVLCSFIKWGGVRILNDSLTAYAENGRPLRVITTSYMGATDVKAVEFLRNLAHSEVRVSYDTRRTRLHAKAYIFHRNTGFGSAYIGSSNLSQAALTDGLEWNVKVSQNESPHLWQKICATFDTYWNDSEFVKYTSESHQILKEALALEKGGFDPSNEIRAVFDVHPYPFQQEILDKLAVERLVHARKWNLVVAATGTGKTLISGFDYAREKRLVRENGGSTKLRLLFVAHREEILQQSLGAYRVVLRDHNFGDLLVGDFEPSSMDHLFVSIQSFNSRSLWEKVPPDYYDFVVVDEFHHAAASSYQKLLTYFKPKVLLGLTATPERMDGLDVLSFFGGHVAAEIRLPDAINRKLLCPFQYFGISDATDFSQTRWQRGGYQMDQLDKLLTGNDIRAQLIIDKVGQILTNVSKARGIGFCVSVRHAEYMAEIFKRAGIPAMALSAKTPPEERKAARERLVNREINFIFVVDLYNEGVDIPEVDTILLLRPTESVTVFLQQLGRGLRLHPEKECLTVLDFIGQAHQNFSFESRFRAIIGRTSRRVDQELEQSFPHLPAGCVIQLERIAAQHVLNNIRHAITASRNRMVERIKSFSNETGQPVSLHSFTEYHQIELDEIYRRSSWSRLLVKAGLLPDFDDPDEARLEKGLRRLAHLDSATQITSLLKVLSQASQISQAELNDPLLERYLTMLHSSVWDTTWLPKNLDESIQRLTSNPTLFNELKELLRCALERVEEVPIPLNLPFMCPLELHSAYTRDEILAALGEWTLQEQREVREGTVFLEDLPADLFFVTLNKTEDEFSPTTMYQDYAISDELFHWQSQSTTSEQSPTGQRYIHQREARHTILLFVREDKKRNGLTCPYIFLGPVDYESHKGSRPISFVWKLRHRIPARLLKSMRRLATD